MVQVLSRTLDSTALTPEKVELATITRDPDTGAVGFLLPGTIAHNDHKCIVAIGPILYLDPCGWSLVRKLSKGRLWACGIAPITQQQMVHDHALEIGR